MKQSRIDLLQQVYDYDQDHGGALSISTVGLSGSELMTLRTDIEYLLRNGYMKKGRAYMNTYCLALTEKGEQFVENGFQSPSSTPISSFSFEGATINNAIIGNDASGNEFVVNVGASFSELERIIASKPIEDQETLRDMLHELQQLQNSGNQIDRSRLARFSDCLKKHTDLIVPISQTLIGILFGANQ